MSDDDFNSQNLSIWQYYDKTDEAQRYAACRLCQKVYCYKTTIYNLKQHLIKQHTDDIDIDPSELRNVQAQRRPPCKPVQKYNPWDYFTQCEDVKNSATCNHCGRIFSFKGNVSNLKSHLKRAHFDLIKSFLKGDENTKEAYLESEDEVVENPLADEEAIFERETGGRARCVLCNVSLPNQQAKLVAHLRKEHPNRAAVLEIDEEDASDSNNEDNTYTEVVYLEENEQKKVPLLSVTPLKRRRTITSTKPRIERPRRVSTDDEYQPNLKRKEPPLSKHKFEVDNFLKYLSPLLNEIPEEQFMRLQMEIINMVMMARINKHATKAPEEVRKIPVYDCDEAHPPVLITVRNLEASQSTGSRRQDEEIRNHSLPIRNRCEAVENNSGTIQNNGELQSGVDVNSLQIVNSSNDTVSLEN